MRVREPEAFWRENVVAVVVLTSCSDNVVMAETNGQMSDVFFLYFAMGRGAKPPSKERKQNEAFLVREETFFFISSNPVLAVFLFLESKGTGICR